MKFSSYLVPGGVFLRQTPADANSVIGLLADHLHLTENVHPGYAAAVMQREAVMPTGLPLADDFAVAVPHTDPEHVIRSGIAMATLAAPVAFGSMDDPDRMLPVRVVFALALRSKSEQIDMLRAIGTLLQDTDRLQRLSVATCADEARALLDATR